MNCPAHSVRATLVALSLTLPVATQGQDLRLRTLEVGPNLYMLMGNGGNVALSVGADGAFLIDDQVAPMAPQIVAAVKKHTDKPVRFVINTHWHADHTGGNERLGKAGAIIVAHANTRKRMSSTQFMSAFQSEVAASPAIALPVITFDSDVTFHWNGDEIHASHVENAHTDGDAIVWFKKANVVHMGDVFSNGMYPFVDTDRNGTLTGIIAAVDSVLGQVDSETKIIPGHGVLADKKALAAYRAMLSDVHAAIAEMLGRGMTVDDVVAAKPTAKWDADWGSGFLEPDRWVRIVCASFKTAPSPAVIDALGIRNLGRPLPGMITAGQLTEEQFDALMKQGFRLINLRTAGERGTGWEEQRSGSGSSYVRIPVQGADGINIDNAKLLAEALEQAGDAPVCVYCGSSNRVGALLGLKAHSLDGKSAEEALDLAKRAGATRYHQILKQKLAR